MKLSYFVICSCLVANAIADDWPGWRGADRDGVVKGGAALADAWAEDGPALLWESEEEIPSDHYGGHGGVAVVGDKVYLAVIWHRDVPTDARVLDDRAMRALGHKHASFDRDFVDKVEAARVAMSPRLRGKKLDEFIATWMEENITADQRLKLDFYVKDRLKKARGAVSIADLDVIGEHKGKAFPDVAAFEKWVVALPLSEEVKGRVRDAVPTSDLAADDTVLCLDVKTGKTLWKRALPGEKSPRGAASTPAVVDGRVFVTGSGKLHCLDAATGEHRWSSPVSGKGPGSSVLVHDDRVFALAGHLYALNAESGSVLWVQKEVKGKNSSPVMAGGQLVVADGKSLRGIAPESGEVTWRVDGGGDSTPVFGDGVLVHFAKGKSAQKLRGFDLSSGKAAQLWTHELKARRAAASPLIVGGHAYLLGGDRQMCVDLKSGEIRWQEERKCSISSPFAADGKLFVLENRGGTLSMLKATPDDRVELARGKVGAMSTCSPVLAGTHLLVRGERSLKCFDLAP